MAVLGENSWCAIRYSFILPSLGTLANCVGGAAAVEVDRGLGEFGLGSERVIDESEPPDQGDRGQRGSGGQGVSGCALADAAPRRKHRGLSGQPRR